MRFSLFIHVAMYQGLCSSNLTHTQDQLKSSHELGFNALKDLVMFVIASSTGNLSIEEAP